MSCIIFEEINVYDITSLRAPIKLCRNDSDGVHRSIKNDITGDRRDVGVSALQQSRNISGNTADLFGG